MNSSSGSTQVSQRTILSITLVGIIIVAVTAFIAIKFTKIDNELNKISEFSQNQKDLSQNTSSMNASLENTEEAMNKLASETFQITASISKMDLELNKTKRDLDLMHHELESNKRAIDLLNSTYKDLTKAIAENDKRESEMALANLREESARLEEADKMAAPIRQKIQELEAKIATLTAEMERTKPRMASAVDGATANAWFDRDTKAWNARNEPIRREIDLIFQIIDRENAKLKEIYNK